MKIIVGNSKILSEHSYLRKSRRISHTNDIRNLLLTVTKKESYQFRPNSLYENSQMLTSITILYALLKPKIC